MVPLTVSRLRQWPRIVAVGLVLAVALLAFGLLIGATTASSTTTRIRTVITTVTQESPTQAAQIQADSGTIATLSKQLAVSRRRLTRAERVLRAERRASHRSRRRRRRPARK